MKKIFLSILFVMSVCFAKQATAQDSTQRWGEQRAWEWYNKQPWLCGFNYIPAYAINYTAMWDKTSFDANAIDKELALAEKTGLNVLRAVLQYAVYADDPGYFLKTLNTFAGICDKHHIKFVPALFDDCVFGITFDPHIGKQPEPLKGWYAWAWSPSPGHTMVTDTTTYPKLVAYVKAVIKRFKDDNRILLWDLYNEPTNGGLGSTTFPLLKRVVTAARSVNPSQPLSIDAWNNNQRLNDIVFAASDVITFHNYGNKEQLLKRINELKQHHEELNTNLSISNQNFQNEKQQLELNLQKITQLTKEKQDLQNSLQLSNDTFSQTQKEIQNLKGKIKKETLMIRSLFDF